MKKWRPQEEEYLVLFFRQDRRDPFPLNFRHFQPGVLYFPACGVWRSLCHLTRIGFLSLPYRSWIFDFFLLLPVYLPLVYVFWTERGGEEGRSEEDWKDTLPCIQSSSQLPKRQWRRGADVSLSPYPPPLFFPLLSGLLSLSSLLLISLKYVRCEYTRARIAFFFSFLFKHLGPRASVFEQISQNLLTVLHNMIPKHFPLS